MRSQIPHPIVCQRLAALHAGAAARAALLVARLAALVWRVVAAFRTGTTGRARYFVVVVDTIPAILAARAGQRTVRDLPMCFLPPAGEP